MSQPTRRPLDDPDYPQPRTLPPWLPLAGALAFVAVATLAVALVVGVAFYSSRSTTGDGGRSAKVSTASLPRTLKVRHEGRNAEEWGKDFNDTDWQTCFTAARALQQIGPEVLRFFAAGMSSDIEHVRFYSVHCLTKPAARQHPSVFAPLLTSLLSDPSGRVRAEAGVALVHCEFKEGLPALKAARDREKEANVKVDLGRYVDLLEKK